MEITGNQNRIDPVTKETRCLHHWGYCTSNDNGFKTYTNIYKSWKIITTVKILLKFENMYLGIQGKNKREKKYVSFFKI